MAQRFKNIDRDTPMLLPPDLRDWVGEDDLVHFVIAAVERLPLSRFAVNYVIPPNEWTQTYALTGSR